MRNEKYETRKWFLSDKKKSRDIARLILQISISMVGRTILKDRSCEMIVHSMVGRTILKDRSCEMIISFHGGAHHTYGPLLRIY